MSETFGQRLKGLREARHMTQGDLMKACGWKGSNSRITNYELGPNEPKLADIALMAKALGVTPAYLAYGEGAEPVLLVTDNANPYALEPRIKELVGIMENLPPASQHRVLATAHEEAGKDADKQKIAGKT